ncbi:hypothetical protein [Segniliparus rugosus]|uniref:Uncharacterized protein n=1 Tax=Segniliparus rugosus (strain ATCC BAA-974 / DSM 45345 / CCUG 50838 / CIP 108380 / JCM 13579 / CDC 945) TaxID=679197 RepID=E5XR00_SEGRC|nr:hypothetical protein [Segniliparus rugosus]EFV13240.1 hypothetical protein HMPREF9336_01902 [Segniliparus rugosus ATCC BAA-974]
MLDSPHPASGYDPTINRERAEYARSVAAKFQEAAEEAEDAAIRQRLSDVAKAAGWLGDYIDSLGPDGRIDPLNAAYGRFDKAGLALNELCPLRLDD